MRYAIEIKRASSIGLLKEKHTSYIMYPYESVTGLTEHKFKAWPFDNETQAYDYISKKVLFDANVVPINEDEYIQYLEYQRGIK